MISVVLADSDSFVVPTVVLERLDIPGSFFDWATGAWTQTPANLFAGVLTPSHDLGGRFFFAAPHQQANQFSMEFPMVLWFFKNATPTGKAHNLLKMDSFIVTSPPFAYLTGCDAIYITEPATPF